MRRVVEDALPELTFRSQRLESLSYPNEVRLMRRTKLLIALFGAAIANCRFLPPGALVLQIHGALKGEIGTATALSQYPQVCSRGLGLRWAALAVPGWATPYPSNNSDLMTARIEPHVLARFVARALNESELPALHREFEDEVHTHAREG